MFRFVLVKIKNNKIVYEHKSYKYINSWRMFMFRFSFAHVLLRSMLIYSFKLLWMFAVAFHHYDALYRSLAGYEIPKDIKSLGLGFLGRSLVIVITALGFVIPLDVTLLIGGIALTGLFVGYASRQWMQQIR